MLHYSYRDVVLVSRTKAYARTLHHLWLDRLTLDTSNGIPYLSPFCPPRRTFSRHIARRPSQPRGHGLLVRGRRQLMDHGFHW